MAQLDHGDPLWKAMTTGDPLAAMMMMNEGGVPVSIDADLKSEAALELCGLSGLNKQLQGHPEAGLGHISE
ncbi:MAG: hypothetical protein IOC82_13030 [Aestuariivirga sp.]|uniref:hypothetical protein n=1 Tax=Aestuariivirga sp. TaxID=2650926 RepID=UPI0025BDBBF3|nr:hypothetical protein [Aestuariivirga sp.]MCA3561941.1 hypothetical protein [Aestuariivirga sp.]